jgi:hypothetical protein
MSTIELGAIFFDVMHDKEYEGEIIATDDTPCNKVFVGSKLLCNGEKNQDKKLESKSSSQFSSSLTQNLGIVHLKPDVHIAYDIQFGCSWNHWKYKEIIFPMGPVLDQNSFGINRNHKNK